MKRITYLCNQDQGISEILDEDTIFNVLAFRVHAVTAAAMTAAQVMLALIARIPGKVRRKTS